MNESAFRQDVIRSAAVRRHAQPVMLDCGEGVGGGTGRPISVVPLMDGDVVAGFEVRCGCGSMVVVDCVYDDDTRAPMPTEQEEQ